MAVLSAGVAARQQWRDAGRQVAAALGWLLFAAGWLAAKTLRTIALVLAGGLFAVGWGAARVLWPALCWCGRAIRLGWHDGSTPIGGQRGPA